MGQSDLPILEDRYDGTFFRYRRKWHIHGKQRRVPYVVQGIKEMFNPKSVIDIGCAIGDTIKGLLEVGIEAYGIEGSRAAEEYLVAPKERVRFLDLRIPIPLPVTTFDLVHCIEVAEHIEPEYADIFLDNLVLFSNKILMSAAPPGQKGKGHVNCQPKEYWIEKMGARGYSHSQAIADAFWEYVAPAGGKASRIIFHRNLMVFQR